MKVNGKCPWFVYMLNQTRWFDSIYSQRAVSYCVLYGAVLFLDVCGVLSWNSNCSCRQCWFNTSYTWVFHAASGPINVCICDSCVCKTDLITQYTHTTLRNSFSLAFSHSLRTFPYGNNFRNGNNMRIVGISSFMFGHFNWIVGENDFNHLISYEILRFIYNVNCAYTRTSNAQALLVFMNYFNQIRL